MRVLRSLPICAASKRLRKRGSGWGGLAAKSSLASSPSFPQWKCRRDREPRVPCALLGLSSRPYDKSRLSYRKNSGETIIDCLNTHFARDLVSISCYLLLFSSNFFFLVSLSRPFLFFLFFFGPYHQPSSASPPSFFLTRVVRIACAQFDSRECQRPGYFSRLPILDTVSGETALLDVQVYTGESRDK